MLIVEGGGGCVEEGNYDQYWSAIEPVLVTYSNSYWSPREVVLVRRVTSTGSFLRVQAFRLAP